MNSPYLELQLRKIFESNLVGQQDSCFKYHYLNTIINVCGGSWNKLIDSHQLLFQELFLQSDLDIFSSSATSHLEHNSSLSIKKGQR